MAIDHKEFKLIYRFDRSLSHCQERLAAAYGQLFDKIDELDKGEVAPIKTERTSDNTVRINKKNK